jgi:integrase
MIDHKNTPETGADLLRLLDDRDDLTPGRLRDLKSAVKRICEMARIAPARLPANPVALRSVLRGIRPAAHSVTEKTWSNMRSALGATLQLAGVADPMGQGAARHSPVWAPLLLPVQENKRISNGLAAFANWCVAEGISPDGVDDNAVQRFSTWLETRTLCPRPHDVVRQVPKFWNEASETIEIWPKAKLTPISFKPPRLRLPLEALSKAFQDDTKAYLKMRADPDIFDERPNAPKQPLAQSTLHQQSEHLRLAASILIDSGIPVEEITSLADLVQPERFKTVLRHYHKRGDERPNAFVVCLAKTLIQAAYHHVAVPEDEVARLKRIAARLPSIPLKLTAKNKAFLREFESDGLRAKLLFLPDKLIAEVTGALDEGRVDFVKAQVAIAIEILLAIPLRPQNLSRLNWQHHFQEPDGPKGRVLLHIPKEEMKSRKHDYDAEVPDYVARRLRWYRRHILPRLNADPNGDLFVTRHGKPKSQETLTQQIIQVIEDYVGIHMTPHQFRHLAGHSYLNDNPKDIETSRALLGHGSIKTTRIYVGSDSRRATRVYNDFVFEQRQSLKLKAKRRPRRKAKKEAA